MRKFLHQAKKVLGWFAKSSASPAPDRPTWVKALDVTATVMPLTFILFSTAVEFTHPGYNPWQDVISLLVWGPYGWIQTVSFYLLSFSVLFLAAKLYIRGAGRLRLRIGVIMLALMGLGLVMVATHPMDPPGFSGTVTGIIHLQTTAVLVLSFPAACFIMATDLRKCLSRRWLSKYTVASGIAGILFIGITAVLVKGNLGWVGVGERLIMVNGLMWIQVVGLTAL